MELLEYQTEDTKRPFGDWFDSLDAIAAVRINTALTRLAAGNLSNVEPVGAGVAECKIDWGPGYRIYFGKDGERIVILLTGGTKKRQSADIAKAKRFWDDYKRRKRLSRAP
ncbi:MAG: type II toxin-antitoxin system RelE/ParE family toxin [Rhodospirillales bacterium]|nr:MAG: type II toxin-antitoxin system RelE/ParE family toxin [Rhodospirillales bacterium]